jgi:tetratricopeptide (TPR) repeat protein
MYLKGSKWSVAHRKKRANPFNIIFLVLLIGIAIYVNQVVVPATGPLFIPTNTPTRAPESFITDAEAIFKAGKIEPAIKAYQVAIQVNPKNVSLHLTMAQLLIDTGKYTQAVKEAENALIINHSWLCARSCR